MRGGSALVKVRVLTLEVIMKEVLRRVGRVREFIVTEQ